MSERPVPLPCRYCGGPDLEDGEPTGSGVCGLCWWTMRLEPEEFESRMAQLGRAVEHVPQCMATEDGRVIFVNRNPYEPVVGIDRGEETTAIRARLPDPRIPVAMPIPIWGVAKLGEGDEP